MPQLGHSPAGSSHSPAANPAHRMTDSDIKKPTSLRRFHLFLPLFLSLAVTFGFCPRPADCQTSADYSNKELHYSLRLPYGWIVIPKIAIEETQQKISQKTGAPVQNFVAGFQKNSEDYFSYPYLLIQHRFVPHTSLEQLATDARNADLKSEDQSFSKAGLANDLSAGQSVIDPEHNALITKIKLEIPKAGLIDGTMAAIPGRDGIVQLSFFAPADKQAEYQAVFSEVLDSFKFDSSFGYSPPGRPENSRWTKYAIGAIVLVLFLFFIRRPKNPEDDDSPAKLPT